MSALEADMSSFDFAYPYSDFSQPSTPSPPMPSMDFSLDPSFFELDMSASFVPQTYTTPKQQARGHARSSSRGSVYSAVSTVESTPDSVCTRLTTPPRASPPVRHHGPILLPKIRSQDQDVDSAPPTHRHAASQKLPAHVKPVRSSHARSYTNPETLNSMAFAHMSFSNSQQSFSSQQSDDFSSSLLCQPVTWNQDSSSKLPQHSRRSSSVDAATIDKYGYPTYRQMPLLQQQDFNFASNYAPRAPSPLSMAATATPEPTPSTTLMSFLTSPNPAASLVRTVSFPHRDPNIKHFWWDVRSVRSWSGFNAAAIHALPGASGLLSTPVPAPVLPQPSMSARHPETEAALHSIYASYYLPKLNSALSLSSSRPIQLSVPSTKRGTTASDLLFVANPAGESSTAAAMFGGKPTARVVGLVRTFDRFNTGMRVEGNIKRVEYLRGLAALHHAMREHGCRYGFILTEIELVLVRNGTESTPVFGDLEVTSVQLNASSEDSESTTLTACLALWGLCQMASDQAQPGQAHWKSEIGAPAEGTRRKAKSRDSWMPAPQLAEKREAKRSRGWVMPEDAVGRKELGKRGVKYSGI